MKKILPKEFFHRPVLDVARDLMGKHLVRQHNGSLISLKITEVEAYDGPQDKACHGRFGKTNRTTPMFGPAGNFYIYLVYGMHWMLNIVTNDVHYPAAVLIRSAGKISGPARLTKRLHIDKNLNAQPACVQTGLWFEEGENLLPKQSIQTTTRIGIDYAGPEWSQKLYRFVLKQ